MNSKTYNINLTEETKSTLMMVINELADEAMELFSTTTVIYGDFEITAHNNSELFIMKDGAVIAVCDELTFEIYVNDNSRMKSVVQNLIANLLELAPVKLAA